MAMAGSSKAPVSGRGVSGSLAYMVSRFATDRSANDTPFQSGLGLMLAQEARQHFYEAIELVERDEVAAVREVDAPAVAPVLLEHGRAGFDVSARHHRAGRQQQDRAINPGDSLRFL